MYHACRISRPLHNLFIAEMRTVRNYTNFSLFVEKCFLCVVKVRNKLMFNIIIVIESIFVSVTMVTCALGILQYFALEILLRTFSQL